MSRTMEMIEVFVPDIGDFEDVPVIEVLAVPGAVVAVDDTLLVLESDKATIDVPSPSAGVVREVHVKLGDRVSEGSLLILLESGAENVARSAPLPLEAAAAPAVAEVMAPAALPETAGDLLPHASPSIRRLARELGVDLARLTGSAASGRIQKTDILDFVKQAVSRPDTLVDNERTTAGLGLLPWPRIDFEKFGPIERQPLSKIRQISGANLARNAVMIPHVTNFDEADVTSLEAFRVTINQERQATGKKLTMLAFMIKAAVCALQQHPSFNASLDGDELILKHYFHIGFAADTPHGLVVPVIKDADKKGLTEIAEEAAQLAEQARQGKLKPSDMQGGSFTISSLGGIGGSGFTPIINAPEVAILGAARAKTTPIYVGESLQPRLIMPVSLSWDHRVIDGAAAARFLLTFTGLLGDLRRVLL